MERGKRDGVARGVACAAALAAFAALREAFGFDPAFLVVFAVGLLTALAELPGLGAVRAPRPRAGSFDGLGARVGGGLLAVLALVTVHWARYGTLVGDVPASVEGLQNVVAASLGAGLLMRLPLLVELGNQPLADRE
jgi:hypothetical protein